jgi:hypothetical protein
VLRPNRVERLDGNIGYLDVRRVPMPENAGPAITAAMELIAGTYVQPRTLPVLAPSTRRSSRADG